MTGLFLSLFVASQNPSVWTRLPSLPDAEGFAGIYAGVSHGVLLVAGGANFPDKKPWDGGKKVWTDAVYALTKPDGEWKIVGKLPRPLGYGVSVSHRDGVLCIGGNDADRHYAEAFRLEMKDGKLTTRNLPSLPQPVANACGAIVGDTLIVAGGIAKPDSTESLDTVYRLDLAATEPKWQVEKCIPGGGRMLAVAAGCNGQFWIAGGVDLSKGRDGKPVRRSLNDAFVLNLKTGWQRIADLPRGVAAAPSPAPADANGFFILGGDDGSQWTTASAQHRGFSKSILRYDLATEKWIEAGELPASRVTTSAVIWDQSWVVPSGEARPGVRSPEVWSRASHKKGQ